MDWQSKQMSALQQNPPAHPQLQIHQPAAMANRSNFVEYRGAQLDRSSYRSLRCLNGSNNSASSRDNSYSVDEVQAKNPQAQPLHLAELEDELNQHLDHLAIIAVKVKMENDHLYAKLKSESSYQASEAKVESKPAATAPSSSNSPAASASSSPVLASAKPKGKRRKVVKTPSQASKHHAMNTRFKGKKHPVTHF